MKTRKSTIAFIWIIFLILLSGCSDPVELPGDISGIVTEKETNLPLDSVTIELDPARNDVTSATTISDGSYLMENIEPGDYDITAVKPTYESVTKEVTVLSETSHEIDFELSKAPYPEFSVTYLDFGEEFTSRSFTIKNISTGTLRYSFHSALEWINISPSSGEATDEVDTITVTIDRASLSDETYKEKIRILSLSGEEDVWDTVHIYVNGLIDADENYYRIVTIGTQTWMAENLNTGEILHPNISYATIGAEQTENDVIEKYCYGNDDRNCDSLGGLYTWKEMMDYTPSDTGTIGTTQGICPAGWHVPTLAEWETLFEYCGGESVAGNALKATGNKLDGTGPWESDNEGATDIFGFTVLPAGAYGYWTENEIWGFWDIEKYGEFWSSHLYPEEIPVRAQHMAFRSIWDYVWKTYGIGIDHAFSVRCIKDPE